MTRCDVKGLYHDLDAGLCKVVSLMQMCNHMLQHFPPSLPSSSLALSAALVFCSCFCDNPYYCRLVLPQYFSSNRLCLLDRGWIFAIAHIRGGGEMGRFWWVPC